VKTIAFFNNEGGVGKTTLVYHLAWTFADLGVNVVAADLDPQSNLTSAFLEDERIDELWTSKKKPLTVLGALQKLQDKLGDVMEPHVELVAPRIGLVPGDLALNLFEDRLAEAWRDSLSDNPSTLADAFRVMRAFRRIMFLAAKARGAELVLIDVGPNLGALNRAALIAADYVAMPLGADLFSLRGLQNLGPTLRGWRTGWATRRARADDKTKLPRGSMTPIGYVVMGHQERSSQPAKAYGRWVARIPATYAEHVLQVAVDDPKVTDAELARLKNFHSLMPLAQDARKPIFHLTAADGALGSHAVAARNAAVDFQALARLIAAKCEIAIP
jgi:chromosome partitioning protein